MELNAGHVAVVTGGASGIGLALCEEFGRRGLSVVVADIEQRALDEAVQSLGKAGIDALAVVCDVTDEAAVNDLAETAFAWKGHVNVICNNAGVVAFGGAFESLADWKWVIDVDMWGVIYGLHAFVPRMKESDQPGYVINTASTAGLLGFPHITSYVAAKHAVVGMSQSLWHELRHSNVGISVLCPGVVATNINTSHRNKPGTDTDSVAKEEFGAGHSETMAAAEVAVVVAEAIEADQFWILPHENYGPMALAVAQGRVDKQPPVMPRTDAS